MAGLLRVFRFENGFVGLCILAALVIAWGGVTIVLTLLSLGAYALIRSPLLLDLHDQAATVAAVLVLLAFAAAAAQRLVRTG